MSWHLGKIAIALTTGIASVGLGAAAQEPIPIDGPTVIDEPGYYVLTRDLTVSSGTAIEIAANDVTIDLNGFAITSESPSGSLIRAYYQRNLRVTNGSIRGGAYGFGDEYCDGGWPLRFESTFQVDRVSFSGQSDSAIFIRGTGCGLDCRAVVENNTIEGGRRAIRIGDCVGGLRIRGNSILNADYGVYTESSGGDGSQISDNFITGTSVGITLAPGFRRGTVERNRVLSCDPASRNTCIHVVWQSWENRVDSNVCIGSSYITVGERDNILSGNTVMPHGMISFDSCGNTYSGNRVPGGVFDIPGCNTDGGGNVTEPICEPLPRAYWSRQCLAATDDDGRGPRRTAEPGFAGHLAPCVAASGGPGCEAIDPEPRADPCARARAQLAASSFNKLSARLQDECSVDLRPRGCISQTVGELIQETTALVLSGQDQACRQAAQCLAAINQGVFELGDTLSAYAGDPVWTATSRELVRLDSATGTVVQRIPQDDQIESIDVDPISGDLCVGLLYGGFRRYSATGVLRTDIQTGDNIYVVGADPTTSDCWVGGGGGLVRLAPDGVEVAEAMEAREPHFDIAVDPRDGSVWALDLPNRTNRDPARVLHVDAEGITLGSFSFQPDPPASFGIAVSIDPRNGTAWTNDLFRNWIFKLDPVTHLPLLSFPISRPGAVAVDPADGSLWTSWRFSDSGGLDKYDEDGTLLFSIADYLNVGSRGIAIDPDDSSVWVLDDQRGGPGARIDHLDASGNLLLSVPASAISPWESRFIRVGPAPALPPLEAAGPLFYDLIDALGLPGALANALLGHVDGAVRQAERGNPAGAAGALGSLILQLEAQSGKKIASGDADELISIARAYIDGM